MTSKSGKAKGRNLQKWVAAKVAGILGVTHGYEDDRMVKPRIMGQRGDDIIVDRSLYFPWSIECKAVEKLDLMATIKQCEANCGEYKNWMIVHKRNTLKEPIVIMKWEAFEHMARILQDGRDE